MDDATVEILINIRDQGRQNLTEAQAGLDLLRRAVEKFAQAQTDGMTATFAMREALKSFRDQAIEAGLSVEAQRVAINGARNAMLEYNLALANGWPEEAALTAAVALNTVEMNRNKDAVNDAKRSWTEFAGMNVIAGLLGPGAGRVGGDLLGAFRTVVPVAAAVAAIFPFVAALSAALVVMTAFSVAAAGMALILGSVSIGFLGLGAAVLYLGNAFGTANKIPQLAANLKEMFQDFAQLAGPSANRIATFINSLLPLAEGEGDRLISWFGARLPNALTSMRVVIRDLLPDINAFGTFLGNIYNHVAPQLGPMFELLAKFGFGAFQGLISNLVALSDWFQKELPTMGPVAAQMFSGLGSAVQFLATQFGNLSDWFIGQWPNIKKNLDAFTSGFSDAFTQLNRQMGGGGTVDWTGFFKTLGETAGGAGAIIGNVWRVLGILFAQVAAAMPAALQTIGANWATFVRGLYTDINAVITAWNSLPAPLRGGVATPLLTLPQSPGMGGTTASSTTPVNKRSGGNVYVSITGTDTNNAGAVSRSVVSGMRKIGAV